MFLKMKNIKASVCPNKFHIFYFGFASFFLVLAISWSALFNFVLKTQLQLEPSSIMYNNWVKNPLPIYLELYFFNFTNAAEFSLNKSVVPNFEEVGPFVFEEKREKVNISWSETGETVTFNQTKQWQLVTEKSPNFSVPITNLNPVAATLVYLSRLWESNLQKAIVNTLLTKHEGLLLTAPARQWLFDGIPDDFLNIFNTLRKVTHIPIPYEKFGWFLNRNMSSSFDGIFKINSGKKRLKDLGQMISWNNKSKTEFYEDHCGLVFGSTGEVNPPLDLFQKNLSLFSSEICSYVNLKFSGIKSINGIDGYEYIGDESMFDNGTWYPENACFNRERSFSSGLRNVSSCRYGSPAFISFPHFYLADPSYSKTMTGMDPDENKHKFVLNVEPKTGIPLFVSGSFQISFLMKSYPWSDVFRDVPEIYVPMIWFKQMVVVTDDFASPLKLLLFFHNFGAYIFCATSFLLFFSFATVKIYGHFFSH